MVRGIAGRLTVDGDVDVLGGVVGGSLHKGGGGEDQDVRAGRVLGRAQLRRLHVQSGAAAKHRARRHRV